MSDEPRYPMTSAELAAAKRFQDWLDRGGPLEAEEKKPEPPADGQLGLFDDEQAAA